MLRWGLAVVFVLSAFSGCLGQSIEAEKDADSGAAQFDLRLTMEDCQGMLVLSDMPSAIVGAYPPTGWASSDVPIAVVTTEIHLCRSISIEGVESRNASFVIQTHDNRSTPEACASGLGVDFYVTEVVQMVIVSDQRLLDVLLSLGVPALLGTVEFTDQNTNRLIQRTWAVTVNGLARAELNVVSVGPSNDPGQLINRRFWTNPSGGISFMDFDDRFRFDSDVLAEPTHGTLRAPFLHMPGEAFAENGVAFEQNEVDAPVQQFQDPYCEDQS